MGKTSSARIFAKCLNCEKGPTTDPCNECSICEAVSVGEDIDVLEIDGASNRGIDEIRQLRSNVAVRPSRARYKIYIIDEVHMLTSQAFNALLKTLEEPPAHVKFIFCTTDPQKIPITVLSRCQRFDFSPVKTDKIADRLRSIAENENVTADDAALQLLARRANGSMRDSQSLLEQLLSFCGDKITVDEVHQLLGTTDISRIAEIATAMTQRDSRTTISLIHENISSGSGAGQLAAQLLAYFRDMMVTRVGCDEDTLLCCSSNEIDALTKQGEQLGLETILMVVQLLDNAVVAMQSSLHTRTLLEVAAVKICGLEQLESISALIKSLSGVGNVTIEAGQGGTAAKLGNNSDESSENEPTKKPIKKATASKKNEINNLQKNTDATAVTDVVSHQRATAPAPITAAVTAGTSAAVSPNTETIRVTERGETTVLADDQTAGTQSHKHKELGEPAPTSVSQLASDNSGEPVPAPAEMRQTSSPQTIATEHPGSSSEVQAVIATPPSTGTEITAQNAAGVYQKALSAMGDMTANMAQRFEKVELAQGKMVVTLLDAYNTNLCSKPERKAKIESAIKELTGKTIRIDFVTTTKRPVDSVAAKPKLSRIQQIRALQEHPFVKHAVELFDCEITDYYQR